jgi:Skp family chaperone for outer membrane proteins
MKTFLRIIVSVLLTYALLAFVSCGRPRTEEGQSESAEAQHEELQREREAAARDLHKLRDTIDDRIEKVAAKVETASEDGKKRLTEANKQLLHDRAEVEEALKSIGTASEKDWKSVQKKTSTVFQNVKRNCDRLDTHMADLVDV